ncbi:uncharacterized protein BP5553_02708 [Venustampulla echinocandica]|uniref:Secreted protein n=1 Tax=Venustampulla echinocandica TaxID=2656787 RepID=A0A370TSA3_9HELO|nr:uncharacterized protein BP5553_02708 [Venustampulla echinocandica]RDL38368.1 hypothetical protein BP5553_02708 [Venustampulla echinocandica]
MISQIFTSLLAAVCIITPVTATPVSATDIDLSKVKYNGILSRGGQGCDQQHPAAVSINGAAVGLVESFPQFTASYKSGDAVDKQRQFCQVAIDISYPDGLQYRVKEVTVIDSARISEGASAIHDITLYFGGSTDQSTVSKTITGPVANNAIPSTNVISNKVWSPCNESQYLNIKNAARINAGTSKDKNSVSIKYVVFGLEWRRC